MKSTTPQPVFARASDSGSSHAENALHFSNRVQQSPKLLYLAMRDETGQVTHRWPLTHTKSTIGSSDSCSVVCTLPGIEPLNAIIVQGARQAFIRALSPNLTQDGVATNELLLTERKSNFELAGHRFELIRQPDQPAQAIQQPSRLRFTSARPFEIKRSTPASRYATPVEPHLPSDLANAPWLRGLIERTIEPLEAQIASLLMPVQEYQTQVLQAQQLQSVQTNQEQQKQAALTQEISSVVARQSATMESLGERLRDVNHQLETIERIIAEDSELESKAKDSFSQEVGVQRVAIDQLQTGMVAVSESLNQLHDRQHSMREEYQSWREEIQERLESLSHVVTEIKERTHHRVDSEILAAVQSLQQSHLLAQEEVQRWQYGLHDQLEALEKKISDFSSLPSTTSTAAQDLLDSMDPAGKPSDDVAVIESDGGHRQTASNDWLDQWTTIQPADLSKDSTDPTLDEPIPEFISDAGSTGIEFETATSDEMRDEQSIELHQDSKLVNADDLDSPGPSLHERVASSVPAEVRDLVWDDAPESNEQDVDYAPTILTDSSSLMNFNQTSSNVDSGQLEDSHNLLVWKQDEVEWSQVPSLDSQAKDHAPADSEGLDDASAWEQAPNFEETPVGSSTPDASVGSHNAQSQMEPSAEDAEADFYFGSTQLVDSKVNSNETDSKSESWQFDDPGNGFASESNSSSEATESNTTESRSAALPSWWVEEEVEDSEVPSIERGLHTRIGEHEPTTASSDHDFPERIAFSSGVDSEELALGELDTSVDADLTSHEEGVQTPISEVLTSDRLALESTDFGSDKGDETSVEQYMRDLLTRMRGPQTEVPEPAVSKPQATSGPSFNTDKPSVPNPSIADELVDSAVAEESFDSENYVSLTNAPEKAKNIHALRDLANNSARHAIRKSARQKYISTSLLKLAICVIALTVSGVLFSINGLELNIGLVATFASLLVAAIWGYDAISSLRPLLKSSLVLSPPDSVANSDSEDQQD